MIVTLTASIEIFLGLPHMNIFIMMEACKATYQLSSYGLLKISILGYARFTEIISNPILQMGSDRTVPHYSFAKTLKSETHLWWIKIEIGKTGELVRYTNGSQPSERTDASVYRLRSWVKCTIPIGIGSVISGILHLSLGAGIWGVATIKPIFTFTLTVRHLLKHL